MLFISSKKLFLFSRYSTVWTFFASFPHFPGSKGKLKVEQLMMSWIGLHKVINVIFGITQKLLYITHETWSGNISQIKDLFGTCFVT